MQVEPPANPAAAEPTVGDVRRVLLRIHACDEAEDWFFNAGLTPRQAWEQCRRGDWLLWLCGQVGVDRRLLVRAACDVVRPALRFVPITDDRPRRVLDMADAWGRGEAVDPAVVQAVAREIGAAHVTRHDPHPRRMAEIAAQYLADAVEGDRFSATDLSCAAWAAADAVAAECGPRADQARPLAEELAAVAVRKRVDWPAVAAALVAFAAR